MTILEALVAIGPRPAGTPVEQNVLTLLEDEVMRAVGRRAERQTFTYPGWRLLAGPVLCLDGPGGQRVDAAPMLGSAPAHGVTGTIQPGGVAVIWGMYRWERLRVVEAGQSVAYLLVRPEGPAIPQYLAPDAPDLGHAVITRVERDRLLGRRVYLEMAVERGPAQGTNLMLAPRVAGPALWIVAHWDTVPLSPGGYDNAAGVQAAVGALGRLAPDARERVGLLLTGAEELGLRGSRHAAEALSSAGTVGAVVNLDGAGRGDLLEAWSGGGEWTRRLEARMPSLRIVTPAPPGSDHTPFHDRGLPVVMLTIDDQDLIHTARDDGSDPRVQRNARRLEDTAVKVVEDYLAWRGGD